MAQSSGKKKGGGGGRASLAAVPHCGPTYTNWFGMEVGEKGEGSSAYPSPFFSECTGAVPAGKKPQLKRNRWSLEAISDKETIVNSSSYTTETLKQQIFLQKDQLWQKTKCKKTTTKSVIPLT